MDRRTEQVERLIASVVIGVLCGATTAAGLAFLLFFGFSRVGIIGWAWEQPAVAGLVCAGVGLLVGVVAAVFNIRE